MTTASKKYKITVLLSLSMNFLLAVVLLLLIYQIYPQFIYNLDSVQRLWDEYSVRTYTKESGGKCYFEILNNHRRIYSESGLGTFTIEQLGQDITGNGRPYLLVKNWEGGAHGDSVYRLFDLNDNVKYLDSIKGLLDVNFKDINNDGVVEILGRDQSFGYFHGFSFAESPMPYVVLSFDSGKSKFLPNRLLLLRQKMSKDELDQLALKYKNDSAWEKQARPPSELLQTVLELIYGGNEKQAWELYDDSWSLDSQSAEEYKKTLLQDMQKSPFFKKI